MKKWYLSKTLWVNALAVVAMVVAGVTGQEWLSTEVQVSILAVINLIIRVVTKQPLGR